MKIYAKKESGLLKPLSFLFHCSPILPLKMLLSDGIFPIK